MFDSAAATEAINDGTSFKDFYISRMRETPANAKYSDIELIGVGILDELSRAARLAFKKAGVGADNVITFAEKGEVWIAFKDLKTGESTIHENLNFVLNEIFDPGGPGDKNYVEEFIKALVVNVDKQISDAVAAGGNIGVQFKDFTFRMKPLTYKDVEDAVGFQQYVVEPDYNFYSRLSGDEWASHLKSTGPDPCQNIPADKSERSLNFAYTNLLSIELLDQLGFGSLLGCAAALKDWPRSKNILFSSETINKETQKVKVNILK